MSKHALQRFRSEVYPQFKSRLSEKDVNFIEHVIFMGPVSSSFSSPSPTSFLIDTLCETEHVAAQNDWSTSNTIMTTDLFNLVLDVDETSAIGSSAQITEIGNSIDNILKERIFKPLAKLIDAAKTTDVLITKVNMSKIIIDTLSEINTAVTASISVKTMATQIQQKALFYLLDSWFDMCYGMLITVDAMSDMLMSQTISVTARFVHLAQAYLYFYEQPKAFDDLELSTRVTDVIAKVDVLGKVGARKESDNMNSSLLVKSTTEDVNYLKNMNVNLSNDKEYAKEQMERQRFLANAETWVFFIVLKLCVLSTLAMGYFSPGTNIAIMVIVCVSVLWLVFVESVNMMQQQEKAV